MDKTELKLCCRCKEAKPHSGFNKDKAAWDGVQAKCRECQRILRKTWYEANRESEIAKAIAWSKANPEKTRERDRRRFQLNPNRRAKNKAYAKAHPEKMLQYKRKWQGENMEKVRASARRLYAKDRDGAVAKIHRRRALKLANGGTYTAADIARLRILQKSRCACCKKKTRLTVDHVVALARGGSNSAENLQLLCKPCNCRKNAKHPIVFMQENGYLL